MTAEEQSPVRRGDILAGRYRVDDVIGLGGMGVVVAATHLELDHRVALKFLLARASSNPAHVERFLREGKSAAKLKSQHVTRVMDVGRLEGGEPYIVMELLSGSTLAEVLRRRGRLPAVAAGYLLQAAEGISEAHAAGIVHRDLKPENLFVTKGPDGRDLVKVLDFGISKSTATENISLTQTNSIMGSPAYMSPEQMRSTKTVDGRSDIWSLGVILYELLTGELPYAAESLAALAFRIAEEAPPNPLARRPDLPPELGAFTLSCLERNRDWRCADIAAFARGLEHFASPEERERVRRIEATMEAVVGARVTPSQPDIVIGSSPSSRKELAAVESSKTENLSATPAHSTNPTVRLPGGSANLPAAASDVAAAPSTPSPRASSRTPIILVAAVAATGLGVLLLRGTAERKPPELSASAVASAKPAASDATLPAVVLDGAVAGEKTVAPVVDAAAPTPLAARPSRPVVTRPAAPAVSASGNAPPPPRPSAEGPFLRSRE